MENQNVNQTQEQKQPQGWRDVVITPDMPLAAIVQFFNILNQRLCTNGEKLSISEVYRIQAEQEQQAQEKQTEEKGE